MGFVCDYTNGVILIIGIALCLGINVIGYMTKKAWFPMALSIFNLSMVIVHINLRSFFTNHEIIFNVCTDLAFMAISIVFLLIVDEIESRRSVIKNVFDKKYKKSKE